MSVHGQLVTGQMLTALLALLDGLVKGDDASKDALGPASLQTLMQIFTGELPVESSSAPTGQKKGRSPSVPRG